MTHFIDIKKLITYLIFCIFLTNISSYNPLFSDVKSTSGTLHFDKDADGNAEMTLSSIGLGIGINPSSNLHVLGNGIINQKLSIGSNTSTSNLNISGSIGFSMNEISSDNLLDSDSVYLIDSSAGNLNLVLPPSSSVLGRVLTLKKKSNDHQVIITTLDASGIDGYKAILLEGNSSQYPDLKVIAGSDQWYILSLSGNTASSNLEVFENLEDGDFTDQMVNASTVGNSVTAGIGVGGSQAVDNNNDGSLAVGSSNVTIPAKTTFSVMAKYEVYNSSFTTHGSLSVGWDTSGDTYQPFGGPGIDKMANVGLALAGSANTYSLFARYRHNGLHSGTSLTAEQVTLNDDNWYNMRGTVEFDGTDTFTWTVYIDEFDSTGSTLLNANLLSGSASYTRNIGTQGRFVFMTNRDRGFEVTDNFYYLPE